MLPVIALQSAEAGGQSGFSVDVHDAVMDAFDKFDKPVQAVGVNAVSAGVRVQLGRNFRLFLCESIFEQNSQKLVVHFLIRHTHCGFPPLIP